MACEHAEGFRAWWSLSLLTRNFISGNQCRCRSKRNFLFRDGHEIRGASTKTGMCVFNEMSSRMSLACASYQMLRHIS